MFFAFLTDFITTDLVKRCHQVANNMKFIENKACLRSAFLDHFDIGLPHIAADTLKLACPLRPERVEKAAQGTEEYNGKPLSYVDQVGRFSEGAEGTSKDSYSDRKSVV